MTGEIVSPEAGSTVERCPTVKAMTEGLSAGQNAWLEIGANDGRHFLRPLESVGTNTWATPATLGNRQDEGKSLDVRLIVFGVDEGKVQRHAYDSARKAGRTYVVEQLPQSHRILDEITVTRAPDTRAC